MSRLQGHFTSAGARNPFARALAGLVLILISLIILAIIIVVAIVAIPLIFIAWLLVSLRRLWTAQRSAEPDSRINVRVRENPD